MKHILVPALWAIVFILALMPITLYNLIEAECRQHQVNWTDIQIGLLIATCTITCLLIVILLNVIRNHKDDDFTF